MLEQEQQEEGALPLAEKGGDGRPMDRQEEGSDGVSRIEDPKVPVNPNHLAVPYILPACVLLGLGIGWGVDASQGTSPFWLITCLVGFMVIGLYLVIRESYR